jgi:amidase
VASQLWFEMLVPQFRRFMQADFERDGDDGIRTAMRYMVENVPDRGEAANLVAMAARLKLVREWNLFLARVPLVLAPVSAVPPYARGFDLESAARTAEVWRECATLMALPVLGLPGIAVPTGVAEGLPVGVQIIAPRFREDLCFAAAEVVEAAAGMLGRLPLDPKMGK